MFARIRCNDELPVRGNYAYIHESWLQTSILEAVIAQSTYGGELIQTQLVSAATANQGLSMGLVFEHAMWVSVFGNGSFAWAQLHPL